MRVMVIVKATKDSEAGILPTRELLNKMGKYNEELHKAGILLAGPIPVPVNLKTNLDPCATFNTSSGVRSESFPTRIVCGGILKCPPFSGRIV